MTAIACLTDGPYGNLHTNISEHQSLNIRKNIFIEETRDTYIDIQAGKDVIHVARDADNLMSYGVGAMIAKMATRGVFNSVDEVFKILSKIFTIQNMSGDKGYRFSRRTVFQALKETGLICADLSIREAKPAGTLPTISEISRIIETYENINLAHIQSPGRSRPVVKARFQAIWVMRFVCGHSLTYIGEQLGNRDHTSILNGVNRMRDIRHTDIGDRNNIDMICDESDALALRRHHNILMSQVGIRRVV